MVKECRIHRMLLCLLLLYYQLSRNVMGAGSDRWSGQLYSSEACDDKGKCVSGKEADKVEPNDLVKDRVEHMKTKEGEDPRAKWMESPIKATDEYLIIQGQVIMDRSDTTHMKKLAEIASERGGRIMETGYGMGISARLIHEFNGGNVREHVIIEGNKAVFEQNLSKYANENPKITPKLGFWQDVVLSLESGTFDAILYDTHPVDDKDRFSEQVIHQRDIMKEVYRILKPGGIFTYFANMDTLDGDRKALKLAGFREEDINIKEFVDYDTSDAYCKTYPHCSTIPTGFQLPRVVKGAGTDSNSKSDALWSFVRPYTRAYIRAFGALWSRIKNYFEPSDNEANIYSKEEL
eukprot:gnl/MRDRNA2_/MRDRNA2_147620_c0_seq1.p1 gnl/MRDRNA2_/MRDRNA2_147620_c0~~gnl/MRDRNA2_/MRDRNA2_147620_c0_seq1.p1  ORF type:complete len:349 (+),score=31.73 gnl/MRDRNA2_/MRDRNA2_147620_c0_seq1:203-1249(+)